MPAETPVISADTPTEAPDAALIREPVSLLDPLIVLAKRKWMIGGLTGLIAVVSIVVSLLLPKIYRSTARIMPPEHGQSAAAAILGQLGPMAAVAGRDLGLRNPSDLYVTLLTSRTVADNLIRRFDLQREYKQRLMEETRRQLATFSEIKAERDGVISISVMDRDPRRAAALANGYVEELTALTRNLAVTEAGQRRVFFEQELRHAGDELASSEQELKKAQETTGVFQLDSQAKATIDAVATLRAQIAAGEVRARAMSSFAAPQNPDLIRAQEELRGLRAQMATLEKTGSDSEFGLPLANYPRAGLEYIRKVRDLKYHETVYELLAKQYEAAKIDEGRSSVVVQFLDRAVPPEMKYKPKRTLMVISWTILGALASVLLAFLLEAWNRWRANAMAAAKLDILKTYLYAGPRTRS